jgi:serine/threonine-protein kinase
MFNNRYRIEREMGRGDMGVVYRAHDTMLDREMTIKVVSESGLDILKRRLHS